MLKIKMWLRANLKVYRFLLPYLPYLPYTKRNMQVRKKKNPDLESVAYTLNPL